MQSDGQVRDWLEYTELLPEYIHLLRVFKLVVNTLDRFIIVDKTGILHRINILGHEELMKKMRGRTHHSYDGTFRITPHPFEQVWVVLAFYDK